MLFVIVIVRLLSVNMYRFTCNVHVTVTYIYTYTRPLSVQAENSRLCPILSSSGYNGSLVTWTVLRLTAANLSFLYFLCRASPCPMLRTFAFSWFCWIPDMGRCFSSPQCPDWFSGPPSLLSIEYRRLFLQGVKRSGREAEIEPDLQKNEVIRSRHA
jgi:hypothetical protein